MKYGIPTDDGKTVSSVFGRAKSFAIYDDTDSSLAVLANGGANSEHGAGTGAAAFLAEKGVGVVMAPEVGPKAETALKAGGIRIEYADEGMEVSKVISGTIPALKQGK
jgi:predicted Fe-Mo cluster-binding NifX family protein